MKRKMLLIFAAFAAGNGAWAEFKNNPDENTLWIEDGKEIAVWKDNFGKGFNNTDVLIEPDPKGGFIMQQRKQGKPRTTRNVPVSPEYPYLVYEIKSIEMLNGYRALWLPILGNGMIVMQGNPQPGMFAVDYYENSKLGPSKKEDYLSLDIHGLRVCFKYMKVVKRPDYYIQVDSSAFKDKKFATVGDKLKFTVFLKEEAEDVSLNFYTDTVLPLALNGENRIQLLPEKDSGGKIWSAEIELKNFKVSKEISLLMKAVILGSENAPEALWGKTSYPLRPLIK